MLEGAVIESVKGKENEDGHLSVTFRFGKIRDLPGHRAVVCPPFGQTEKKIENGKVSFLYLACEAGTEIELSLMCIRESDNSAREMKKLRVILPMI